MLIVMEKRRRPGSRWDVSPEARDRVIVEP